MNDYKLWLKNALEQANQDDSWHLNTRANSRSITFSTVITIVGILCFLGIVLLAGAKQC